MPRLSDTITRLTALSGNGPAGLPGGSGRLTEFDGFGSNPGNLAAWSHVPDQLTAGAPLVVVLHGCTQTAAGYDRGSGWSQLADRQGFAVLIPEQRRANNGNLCFNWYRPGDARRGKGEAASIAQMITHLQARHALDTDRTFVTGLSAGGAMTAVMLATYPELFAGGAIIAGLPFGSAANLTQALERMRGTGSPDRNMLAERARKAAPRGKAPPTLSVWHGTRDSIVDPSNASVIVDQWRDLHGLGDAAGTVERSGGHRHETWRDRSGRSVIERYDIEGMGHGTPLDPRGSEACGAAGPHMLDVGICSTRRIAQFWGLGSDAASEARPARPSVVLEAVPMPPKAPQSSPPTSGIGATIEDALRKAGLMR